MRALVILLIGFSSVSAACENYISIGDKKTSCLSTTPVVTAPRYSRADMERAYAPPPPRDVSSSSSSFFSSQPREDDTIHVRAYYDQVYVPYRGGRTVDRVTVIRSGR